MNKKQKIAKRKQKKRRLKLKAKRAELLKNKKVVETKPNSNKKHKLAILTEGPSEKKEKFTQIRQILPATVKSINFS